MSDQDFFFDEDEKPAEKAAEKPAEKAAEKPAKAVSKPATKAAPAKADSAAQDSSSAIELTWTTTALIAVVTLLLGVIVGYAIPKGPSVSDTATGTGTGTGTSAGTAPQLSPEQMQSGELPAGHPDIGAMNGGSTGATGSAETTGN